VNSSVPPSPRCFRCFRNSRQLSLSSFAPSQTPSTSRYPPSFTPTATNTDTFRTSPPQLRFSQIPSSHVYTCCPSIFRLRHSSIRPESFWFSSLIVEELTRLPHSASVMSSTRRTDTPARYISINASSTELSLRRYRSMICVSNGRLRSFGIRSTTSPAFVCSVLSYPPARVSTRSGVRSYLPALHSRSASASSSPLSVSSTELRTTSSTCARISPSSTVRTFFNPGAFFATLFMGRSPCRSGMLSS